MEHIAYNAPNPKLRIVSKHHEARSLRAAHRITKRKEKRRAGL